MQSAPIVPQPLFTLFQRTIAIAKPKLLFSVARTYRLGGILRSVLGPSRQTHGLLRVFVNDICLQCTSQCQQFHSNQTHINSIPPRPLHPIRYLREGRTHDRNSWYNLEQIRRQPFEQPSEPLPFQRLPRHIPNPRIRSLMHRSPLRLQPRP